MAVWLKDFIKSESFGGILLFSAALLAVILSNSPLSHWYDKLLQIKLAVGLGEHLFAKPIYLWINDGLMAVFFLLVGLEIKREIFKGALRDPQAVILPAIGALGGLILPAVIYSYINWGDSIALRGWGIPVATDIAFSLGILTLLGTRVPTSVKIFLTTLAILDDIGAILIIAIFYTRQLAYVSLVFAALAILVLIILNNLRVKNLGVYFLVGFILWVSVLQSGVHATLAGIVLAFAIPLDGDGKVRHSPLVRTEQALIPWVYYFVLPLFAFANSGFSFSGMSVGYLFHGVPFGILMGLFLGKQLGIFSSCWVAVHAGIGKLPKRMTWSMLYGVAILCGVGFTMSLFIGSLAFPAKASDYIRYVRLGVLSGSLASGLIGYWFLSQVTARKK